MPVFRITAQTTIERTRYVKAPSKKAAQAYADNAMSSEMGL